MTQVQVSELKIGDVIMPPAREIGLWMRKRLGEYNLPESALHLTIVNIEEAMPDKRGRWLLVTCDQTPEWLRGGTKYPFKFKARPETPWPKI